MYALLSYPTGLGWNYPSLLNNFSGTLRLFPLDERELVPQCMPAFDMTKHQLRAFIFIYCEQNDELKSMGRNYNMTQPMLDWTL